MTERGIAMCASTAWLHRPEPSVLVLRHPEDRLLSCYRFFQARDKGWPVGTPPLPTFLDFLSHVERCHITNRWNHHWQPQVDQVPHFDFAIPLYRLNEFWSATIGGEVAIENASPPADIAVSESQRAIIGRVYNADALAYNRADETFQSTLEALT